MEVTKSKRSLALVTLVLQTSLHSLLIHYSRTSGTSSSRYLTSTTVVIVELFKTLISWFVVANYETDNPWVIIRSSLPMAVPALVYALQNNLVFFALQHLDAATFQVLYQTKIITTALLSKFMLRKQLSKTQWISLFLLTQGVILVQSPPCSSGPSPITADANPLFGFLVVCCLSCTSGFAGVYFEKQLKSNRASIFGRNLQMGSFGFLFSLMLLLLFDGQALGSQGFFYGYDFITWCIIFVATFGGLLVAAVVQYTDNIAKGFATSISIVLNCLISAALFNFHLSLVFAIGAGVVISSVLLYSDLSAVPDKGLNNVTLQGSGDSAHSRNHQRSISPHLQIRLDVDPAKTRDA